MTYVLIPLKTPLFLCGFLFTSMEETPEWGLGSKLKERIYHISLLMRQRFLLPKNPKYLDPFYKMDLDLWDCLGRVKLIAKFQRTDLVICSLIAK